MEGVRRSIKLNLVTDAFFNKGKPGYDQDSPNAPSIYIKSTLGQFERRVIDLLCYDETTSVFHLTYRDLMEMSPDVFDYVQRKVLELAEANMTKQKELEGSKQQ